MVATRGYRIIATSTSGISPPYATLKQAVVGKVDWVGHGPGVVWGYVDRGTLGTSTGTGRRKCRQRSIRGWWRAGSRPRARPSARSTSGAPRTGRRSNLSEACPRTRLPTLRVQLQPGIYPFPVLKDSRVKHHAPVYTMSCTDVHVVYE